jgi:Bacterial Ig domain
LDTVAPTLYWENPANGTTVSGTYGFTVSSRDDHAVKKIDLYVDGVYQTTTTCEGISYVCQLYYTKSLRGLSGQHTATFEGSDWMGNVTVLTTTFTVS